MTPDTSTFATGRNSTKMISLPVLSLLLTAAFLLLLIQPVSAILPTGSIDVTSPTSGARYTLLASQASFGSYPAMGSRNAANPLMEIVLPPDDDVLLCGETDGTKNYTNYKKPSSNHRGSRELFWGKKKQGLDAPNPNRAMLVPRGSCTFERKALSAQRLGASAVIVYGTLDSRYALNKTKLGPNATDAEKEAADERTYTFDDILWPQDKYDYDCSYGRADVPTSLLNFDPLPYNGRYNDARLTGDADDGNLCAIYSSSDSDSSSSSKQSFAATCPSKRCLLTGNKHSKGNANDDDEGGTTMEACCAWDLHVWLYSDPSIPQWYESVGIPAFYVTMEQGAQLLQTVKESGDESGGSGGSDSSTQSAVGITMYARWAPTYNPSALIIWMLGVAVCFLAAYLSASEYRNLRFEAKRRLFEMTVGAGAAAQGLNVPPGDADADAHAGAYRDEPPMESDIPPASSMRSDASDGTPRARSRSRSPPSPRTSSGSSDARSTSPLQTEEQQQGHYAPSHAVAAAEDDADVAAAANSGTTNHNATANAPATYQHYDSQARSSFNSQEDTLELSTSHALGFVVMASCSLTVLFVFKIYNIVKIMYAFGCSGAMTQILFFPLWDRIGQKLGWRRKMYRTAFNAGSEFGPVTYLDLVAGLSGYGLGLAWLITAFWFVHPEDQAFFWIVQDIMGSCMCILFLSIIKLNSIRVAAVLLIIAFFYDIFFVFVTPLLTKGGKSIMITVATSGGPPKADPSWCEKYPRDDDCKGGDPLPMLLTVPRIFDYQGGSSLLGLGDIVLPGLLLSFAARFDEAKKLVRLVQSGNTAEIYPRSYNCLTVCCKLLCSGGYLIPVTVAYAVGLCMANVAVYLMHMGQPALLYLVPCCLGTMAFHGWKNNELRDLWDGPKSIKLADSMLYGEYEVEEDAVYVEGGDAEEGGGDLAPTIAQIPPKEDHEEPTQVVVADSNSSASGDVLNQRKKQGSTKKG